MKIRSLRVANFRGLGDKTLDFCGSDGRPRTLTVLVGPNMRGKTTVLDALHLVYAALGNANAPSFRPGFDPSDPLLRPDPNQPIDVDLSFELDSGEREELDRLEQLLAQRPLLPEPAQEYRVTFRWPVPPGSHHGVVESTPFAANLALRGRALARLAKARRLVGEGTFERVGGLLYLDQHRGISSDVPITATGSEESLRDGASSRDVLPWLELAARLDQKWDPTTQGESAWRRVKRLFADLAAPATIDDVKAFDEGFDLRFRRGSRYYYSAGLSSGEQQLLRFVVNLTAFRAQRSVVLVDELELHLHPRWQRDILHFCRRGGGDANQFVVTTHSESILKYVDPDDVLRLGMPEDW
jgi:hypothetical protein